ncbi:MAG: HAMP domain-containing sensor histidine kinase [Longicatena sp.]
MLKKNNNISFSISREDMDHLSKEFIGIKAENDNIDIIKEVMEKYLPDYTYILYVIGNDESPFRLYSDGYAPTKHSTKYAQSIRIPFSNDVVSIDFYPKFTKYLIYYRCLAFVISFLITFLCGCLYRHIRKKIKDARIFERHVSSTRLRFLTSLYSKLVLLNLFSVLIALGLFLFMFENRYIFFEYMAEFHSPKHEPSVYIQRMKETLVNVPLETFSDKEVTKLLTSLNLENYESYLYDEYGNDYYANNPDIQEYKWFLKDTNYDIKIITTPYFYNLPICTKNQTFQLLIYDYPVVSYMNTYLIMISMISLSFFLIVLFHFVYKKVREIMKLQNDIQMLAAGIWEYEIITKGDDELASLGYHIEQMRLSHVETQNNEEKRKEANKKLIETLSHDLRTPLTALKSYIEIMQLQKGNPERYAEYLQNCIGKIDEIKKLSDEMFMCSSVPDSKNEVDMKYVSLGDVFALLNENKEYLEIKGFCLYIIKSIDISLDIYGNVNLMKRIFNNIVSNIIKYAEPSKSIICSFELYNKYIILAFKNQKNKKRDDYKSSHLGLKSIEKMMHTMQGEVELIDEECFEIKLYFKIEG